jgi:RND family efflux transporter MFP subunit
MSNPSPETDLTAIARPRAAGAGYIAAIILGAGLLALGIVPRLRQHSELTAAVAASSTESRTPTVEVVQLGAPLSPPTGKPGDAPAPPPADLVLPASIQAVEETTVSARATGYVQKRYVDIGSKVKAGQVLAEIASPDMDEQLSQAQAQTAKSRAGVGQSEADVARLQAGIAQAQAEALRTEASLEQARAALSRARAQQVKARATIAAAQAQQAAAQQALEGKNAALAQERANLELDEKNWKRWEDLGKEGAVAQQEVDAKKTAYEVRLASITAAEAAVRSAEADVTTTREQVQASRSDAAAAQADIVSNAHNIRAAQAQITSSQESVVAARANAVAGRAGVQAAQAQVGADEANVQRYAVLRSFQRIVAPFSGVITSRRVDTGALINAGAGGGAELFGIARTDMLRVTVNIPQRFVATIPPGQKVQVQIREFPGRSFEGTVVRRAGALDVATRTLLTEVRLPNRNGVLLPGMYAQVRFPVAVAGAERGMPHIPANTLVVGADGTRVATVTPDQKIHFVPVQVGRDLGTELEITAGLTGDERLVANPTDELVEGTTVKVATPPAAKLGKPGA